MSGAALDGYAFSVAVSVSTLKILFTLSGNRCAAPRCKNGLVVDQSDEGDARAVVGFVAHIIASSARGPRADPNFPLDQLDAEPNLLLLCGSCHSKVDNQPLKYSPDTLRKWKRKHEARVARQHRRATRGPGPATRRSVAVVSTAAVAVGAGAGWTELRRVDPGPFESPIAQTPDDRRGPAVMPRAKHSVSVAAKTRRKKARPSRSADAAATLTTTSTATPTTTTTGTPNSQPRSSTPPAGSGGSQSTPPAVQQKAPAGGSGGGSTAEPTIRRSSG